MLVVSILFEGMEMLALEIKS